jgi:hypothetical protein
LTIWSGTGAWETPSIVKVTLPDGLPPVPPGATVAVNVTGWPTVDELTEDASVVVVAAKSGAVTVSVGSDPLLAFTFASPLYNADTVCGPAESVAMVTWAWSLLPTRASGTGVCACPSIVKVTMPVGVPSYEGAVTTAVKVTACPDVDGFALEVSVVVVGCKFGSLTVSD